MSGPIKAIRLQNLLLGGGLTATQLEAELGNASTLGAFEGSLRQRTVVAGYKASTVALCTLVSSPAALGALGRQDATIVDPALANASAVDALLTRTTALDYALANDWMLNKLVASSTVRNRLVANATAMGKVAASAAAMTAVIGNPVALAAVVASATAMGAIAAIAAAVTTMVSTAAARAAIYGSDTALSAFAASATAKTALRASPSYVVISQAVPLGAWATIAGITGNTILVGMSSSISITTSLQGRRAGSAVGAGFAAPTSALPVGTTAAMDNVAAITTPAWIDDSNAASTVYFGIIRV